ncbi:MAG: hypothetical protein MK080_08470 [Opitutales bacterium]|nr:hypothetical protein [Opitutales bacterium]
MNIRQTCLIITSVLGLSFITIISFKLTDLYSTKIDSMEMQSSIEATAIMNKAIIELSLERSVMQVNLNLDEPIQPSFRNLIDQQRTISDQGFEDVKQLVDDYGTFRLGDTFIERLEQLETTIQGIRARADQNLSKPLDQRVRGEVSGLPSEMKDVILAFSHLPIKLSADGNQVSTALLSLKLVQENAWAVREFGGRERTHLAIATATGRPIAASIRAEMHADHKRAQEAMARLEVIAESGAINESIVDAIAELKTTYFSTYKATREDLIGASEQGSTLPISFERFFTVSSEALQSAVDLSYLAASEMEGYMNNRRSTSTAQFFFYAGILIAVIVLSAFQFY